MVRTLALFSITAVLAGFFMSCQNPVEITRERSFQDFTLSVTETLLDTVRVEGRTFYNKKAYIVRIRENEDWDPATGDPLFYNLYKVAPDNSTKTFIRKVSGGGKGIAGGDTVCFRNPTGEVDSLVHNPLLEYLIVISTEDKSPFKFGCASVTGAGRVGGKTYAGGIENDDPLVTDGVVRLGGVSRSFSLNDGKPVTITPRVVVTALIDTAGAGVLYLYRYSSVNPVSFTAVASIDSLLKAAAPSDSQYVRINSDNKVKLADSTVYDRFGFYSGKYGGRDTIRLNAFSSYFDGISYGGEAGWIAVRETVTVPVGYGQKWVYLNSPVWSSPMYDDIGIQPFQGEIALDLTAGGLRLNPVEGKVCLFSDQVPFVFRTFGDTTFDQGVSVWLATRNCNNTFMTYNQDQEKWQLANLMIDPSNTNLGYKISWPDAVLETPPQDFSVAGGSDLKGVLTPDYENDYRVSPLYFLFNNASGAAEPLYDKYVFDRPRSNPFALSQLVKRGSLLGYEEKDLNNFKMDHSLPFLDGVLMKKPAAGWFSYVPLSNVSPDSTYSKANLMSYFGIASENDLIPDGNTGSNAYYSIYSAFLYAPDKGYLQANVFQDIWPVTGVRLFRNPFRAMPYFLSYNWQGAKEFVLIACARGKYFKEPRIFISSFSSPYTYVWDKTPPHIAWDSTISPTAENYAPNYFVNPRNPSERQITDLSKTITPYVFNVCLSSSDPYSSRECSIRDVGFGRITTVKLCFNYSADFLSLDPISGRRRYSKATIVAAELSAQDLAAQLFTSYAQGKASYSLGKVAFRNIDARLWQKGLWDMWFETSDDLGNSGVAPVIHAKAYSEKITSVRQIEIK